MLTKIAHRRAYLAGQRNEVFIDEVARGESRDNF